MFGKKFLYLVSGYTLGNVIANIYGSKKGKSEKQDKKGKSEMQSALEAFLQTQKNLLSDIESRLVSDARKWAYQKHKDEFLALGNNMMRTGQSLLAELKSMPNSGVEQVKKQAKKVAKKFEK